MEEERVSREVQLTVIFGSDKDESYIGGGGEHLIIYAHT